MRRNIVNSASGLKTALTIVFSDHDFLNKRTKIVSIWQHRKRVLDTFSPRMRRNRNFRSKIWARHLLRWPRFPMRQMHFHYRVTFTGYIRCFVLLCRMALWPWTLTFDLESVSCIVLLMSDPHTNFYYPTTIGYWVTSTEYVITFPLSETVTVHAPFYVTSNRGQK